MVETTTPTIIEEFNLCFSETNNTRQIETLYWPLDQEFITFRS